MSIWLRSGVANTRRIAPTRATLRTTEFRLAAIVRSMRCGLMRPHLKRWRRSRITSPSIRTVSTRSAEQRRWGRLAAAARGRPHATGLAEPPARKGELTILKELHEHFSDPAVPLAGALK